MCSNNTCNTIIIFCEYFGKLDDSEFNLVFCNLLKRASIELAIFGFL